MGMCQRPSREWRAAAAQQVAVARALLHLERYESESLLSWSFQCTCPLCIELRYVQSLACVTHRVWRVCPPPLAALFRVLAASHFASTSCTAMAEKQIHKVVGAQQTKSAHSSLEQQAKAIIRVQWGSMRQRSD